MDFEQILDKAGTTKYELEEAMRRGTRGTSTRQDQGLCEKVHNLCSKYKCDGYARLNAKTRSEEFEAEHKKYSGGQ